MLASLAFTNRIESVDVFTKLRTDAPDLVNSWRAGLTTDECAMVELLTDSAVYPKVAARQLGKTIDELRLMRYTVVQRLLEAWLDTLPDVPCTLGAEAGGRWPPRFGHTRSSQRNAAAPSARACS